MGKIWIPGGGGGANTDVVTAGADDVLAGKVIVGPDGEPLTGTMADKSDTTQSATATLDATNSRLQMTIPAVGKYNTASKWQSMEFPSWLSRNESD